MKLQTFEVEVSLVSEQGLRGADQSGLSYFEQGVADPLQEEAGLGLHLQQLLQRAPGGAVHRRGTARETREQEVSSWEETFLTRAQDFQ